MPYRWTHTRKVDPGAGSDVAEWRQLNLWRAALTAADETIQGGSLGPEIGDRLGPESASGEAFPSSIFRRLGDLRCFRLAPFSHKCLILLVGRAGIEPATT